MDSKRIYELAKKISELSFSLITEINDSEIEAEKRRSLFQIMPNIKKPKEGSIITRQDGRFEGRYMVERRQKSVYGKTYNDCLNRLNKAIKARDGEVKSVIMFYGWIDEYLQVYKKPDLKPDTYSAYLGYVNNYIKKHCTDCPIAAIKPIDLKKILNSIEFERTRESVYNLLSGIFK